MFCLSSYQNLQFTVPNFFCLAPFVQIQFILLMLRFFCTIALGAVDYEMVDSRNQVKHVAHTKSALIKTVCQLEKMQALTVLRLQ